MAKNIRTIRCLSCLLLLCLVFSTSGCESSPVAPVFPYAGTWEGIWYDHFITIHGIPYSADLTLNIGENGSASASGQGSEDLDMGDSFTDRISMTLTVHPDGAVTGTGTWHLTWPGLTHRREGQVVGQLDAGDWTGSGVLIITIDDVMWHLPWDVTRNDRAW